MKDVMPSLWVSALAGASVSFAAHVASAAPIPGLFATGVDDFGVALAPGAVDPHYALTVSADVSFPAVGPAYVVDPLPVDWLPNSATAQWINHNGSGGSEISGTYAYTITFDLTGFDASTAVVSGSWALDDGLTGASILINGMMTGYTHLYPGWLMLESFTISAGFLPGLNTLTFVTTNEPSIGFNPTGLLVATLHGDADIIPAPASGLALALAFPLMRRRRAVR